MKFAPDADYDFDTGPNGYLDDPATNENRHLITESSMGLIEKEARMVLAFSNGAPVRIENPSPEVLLWMRRRWPQRKDLIRDYAGYLERYEKRVEILGRGLARPGAMPPGENNDEGMEAGAAGGNGAEMRVRCML